MLACMSTMPFDIGAGAVPIPQPLLCRWRFTKSGNLPCGRRVRGQFLKVNHWPSLAISRTPDWGWRMENCWVVYTSNEPRQDVLKEVLLKGRKGIA